MYINLFTYQFVEVLGFRINNRPFFWAKSRKITNVGFSASNVLHNQFSCVCVHCSEIAVYSETGKSRKCVAGEVRFCKEWFM